MSTDKRYQCSECGQVCTLDDMGADCCENDSGEIWSNWICPNPACLYWHDDPVRVGDDSGWSLYSDSK